VTATPAGGVRAAAAARGAGDAHAAASAPARVGAAATRSARSRAAAVIDSSRACLRHVDTASCAFVCTRAARVQRGVSQIGVRVARARGP